jgi:hypothetical protein
MIARDKQDPPDDDIWAKLAAEVDKSAVAWRQDGKAVARGRKFVARFVCYIEANTVRERLDSVVPGNWDLTLESLPAVPDADGVESAGCAFKARISILGVIREDVGTGRDYKAASTDAFKRAAVRFGIGHELYNYEQNWVEVDGDGKFPKPLEDPGVAYARRYGGQPATARPAPRPATAKPAAGPTAPVSDEPEDVGDDPVALAAEDPACPKCGGRCWDNRLTKRNPKAPNFKCRDKSCDGCIWPPKEGNGEGNRKVAERSTNGAKKGKQPISIGGPAAFDDAPPPDDEDFPAALENSLDDLPF